MQRLAQESWRLESETVDVTVAELAYTWGVRNAEYAHDWLHRVWTDRDGAVAWAWLSLPGSLTFQVHPDRCHLLEDVLDWFDASAPQGERAVSVRAANRPAIAALERRGFRRDDDAPWMRLNVRDLTEIDEAKAPPGFRLTTMAEVGRDVSRRVAVHRAAWGAQTRVTETTYPGVMRTWPYRPDLDLVVEGPDGDFVAFVLAWYDDANRVGEFEPVGTDERFRGRGLARALSLFGLHRLREAGATHAIVGSRGDAGYPVPTALYESVGFRELSRNLCYVKRQ